MSASGHLPPVAVLAGGLAKRMRPITATIPKAMIEVAGEPFIAHQLRLLGRQHALRVVLCLGYLGEQVSDFVGDGKQFGLQVAYSFDGESLLGTGGSLRKALPLLGPEFLITYGDSYLDFDWAAVAEAFAGTACTGLLTVYDNADRWDASNVIFRDGRVVAYSKKDRRPEMRYIDYGLAIVKAEALTRHPENTVFDLGDVYSELAAAGQLMGYEVSQRFYEIGSPQGLADFEDYLRRKAS